MLNINASLIKDEMHLGSLQEFPVKHTATN